MARLNPVVANVPVAKNLVKKVLSRLGLNIKDLHEQGRIDVALGYGFIYRASQNRVRFIIEATQDGKINPGLVPEEIQGLILEDTKEFARVAPPSDLELEAQDVARLRKRLLQQIK